MKNESICQLYSHSLSSTRKENPSQSPSINHELLIRGGFIRQESSGIYTLLPFGQKVVQNIESLIRSGMNSLGAEEISMPILQPRAYFETTGRWNKIDVLFKLKSNQGNTEYGLAATAEEVVVPVVKDRIRSYRDLPLVVYQIGEKFRDEKRPKSGIIRGREFGMKDMYSFHATPEDFTSFYKQAKNTYLNLFTACGINAKVTEASGGDFTVLPTHEFQAISAAGEDLIINCDSCTFAQNREITTLKDGGGCPKCGQGHLKTDKSIEIGHIFDLGDKFTKAFDFTFTDSGGKRKPILMGCYGIGTTRLMGTIVETHNDQQGIIWPDSIAPYQYHLAGLNLEDDAVRDQAFQVMTAIQSMGASVLYDDRPDVKAGDKFATADMIGIPNRIVVSKRTFTEGIIELKRRDTGVTSKISLEQLFFTQKRG
ncbi:hypothetical protein KKE48_01060 [Patescibacteria group bacterium]|nr:hypothetical protein [Patescibacteria group bacterium]MBU1499441.1 hypothetical protein [Patescibacteria group bacterium]